MKLGDTLPAAVAAARSCGSDPAIPPRKAATSATVRPIGPAVSSELAIGSTTLRLPRPTVGFKPTTPFTDAGQPQPLSLSAPTLSAARLDAAATAPPEL